MNIKFKTLLLLLALIPLCATAKKKDKQEENQKVYVFGFATTFTSDSIYLTDIQQLDSAFIMKSGFLYSRDSYTYQLRQHMQSIGVDRAVSVISFAKTREKAEKKRAKMSKRYLYPKKKKYTETPNYVVVYIPSSDFTFTAIPADESVLKKDAVWKAEQKAYRQQKKAEIKENKRKAKEAKAERKAANDAAIREQTERNKQERKK